MSSAKGNSTKGLLDHLKLKHGIYHRQKKIIVSCYQALKMKADTNIKIGHSLDGKQTDVNLISELRKGLHDLGYKIPMNGQGVAKVFMKQYAKEKNESR